jgi:hypothetical protein
METTLVSLVSIALIVISAVTMTVSAFQSANKLADSWKTMEKVSSSAARTEITATAPENYSGGILDLTVINEGQINLSDFPRWDVIILFQSGTSRYLTYADTCPPGDNQWAVKGIYMADGLPEVFDRNILNPGEKMIVSASLIPEIGIGEMARATLATPNGITALCYVANGPP